MTNKFSENDFDDFDVDKVTPKFKFELTFKRIGFFLGVILSIAICSSAKYFFGFSIQETISTAAFLIVVFTLWYHANNLFVNVTVNQQKFKFDRKIVALNMITEWYKDFSVNSRRIRDYRKLHLKENGGIVNPQKLREDLDGDDETILRIYLIPILNFFEKIAISILRHAADEKIVRDYFEDIFLRYYSFFEQVIFLRRNEEVGGLPHAFDNFEKIAKSWKLKKNKIED